MNRILCLHFPNWPIQRRHATDASDIRQPLAVYGLVKGKARILVVNRNALRAGITPGMLLVEAQAHSKHSAFEPDDAQADRAVLLQLAHWCLQFAPNVGVENDCLLLDADGATFGYDSEEAFAETIVARLQQRRYWAVAGVADTLGAAWALAHYPRYFATTGHPRVVVSPRGKQRDLLRPLPIEALRLPDKVVALLHDLSLESVGQLLDLPRHELPARFGPELLRALDRALGLCAESFTPIRPETWLEATWEFDPPLGQLSALVMALEELLERLLKRMNAEHSGVKKLLCLLKPERCAMLQFPVELLRPTSALRELLELLRLQLERLTLPAEIETVTLRIVGVAPLEFRQVALFGVEDTARGWSDVERMLERLTSRLGRQAVLRARLDPDAQPEFACRYEAWLGSAAGKSAPGIAAPGLRPVWLCPEPIEVGGTAPELPARFYYRGAWHRRQRFSGPERIETGWWRGADIRRDYYVVDTAAGARFWMFQNLADGTWWLHGVFA